MKLKTVLVALGTFLVAAAPAAADWDEGGICKMHYPQLPDPFGWDVDATAPAMLADDFRCEESGPITDVHLWVSWRGDFVPPDAPGHEAITNVHLSIHEDRRPPQTYSRPGTRLWVADSKNGDFKFTYRLYGQGDQGWMDPTGPHGEQYFPDDHMFFYQINCVEFREPFVQERGKMYWLDVQFETIDYQLQLGWKTSVVKQFEDNAVFRNNLIGGWEPLYDMTGERSLDLAFVITPEPATMTLLALGGIVLARRRRRR